MRMLSELPDRAELASRLHIDQVFCVSFSPMVSYPIFFKFGAIMENSCHWELLAPDTIFDLQTDAAFSDKSSSKKVANIYNSSPGTTIESVNRIGPI
ncbi:hypothetical protein ACTRXD_11090 [Nitrospira sp. T9]|uniref:hypothetical protein n=1 Tax=unclassified Nitrospira TaxID=2652172 RepID=UPI003F9B044E